MATEPLHIALVQMRAGLDPARNVKDACAFIREAASQGATLICTPENTTLIDPDRTRFLHALHEQAEEPALPVFCALAQELGVHLLIGSVPVRISKDKAANRSFVISPKGKILARYDKIHLFDVTINAQESWRESDHVRPGNKAVLADIGAAKLGLSICYDLRFAALYRALAKAGANVLTVPSAFTRVTGRAHWEILLRARAIECGAYVLAPAQGGVHESGRRTWGHSMVVGPWGEVVALRDNDEPGLLLAKLDLRKCESARRRIPALRHDREFTGP